VAVDFEARLRATLKFASVDDLVSQMIVDVDDARRLLTAG
jgi:FAD synthase